MSSSRPLPPRRPRAKSSRPFAIFMGLCAFLGILPILITLLCSPLMYIFGCGANGGYECTRAHWFTNIAQNLAPAAWLAFWTIPGSIVLLLFGALVKFIASRLY
jgi:hypothetical protein